MVTRRKEVDAVVIGVGWTGSVMARELTRAGLTVVGLERGGMRTPAENFEMPGIRDELRYAVRQELFQDTATETVSMRHRPSETALPIRRLGSFLPGAGLGGAGVHWNGLHWRFPPSEHVLRSHLTQRYGKNAIPADMNIEDWGVTYAELEPYYDRFEKLCGVSGKAGNLNGKLVAGGNVFEGPRSAEYPNQPLKQPYAGMVFEDAAKSLGYHPFPGPAANMSAPYTNPEGQTLGACVYCGHCERFGCEANAKASPNVTILPVLLADPKFELRTHAYVKEIVYDKAAKKAKGVRYVDTATGEEYEQPASMVLLCAYTFNNTLLMLVSGIGRPYDPKTGHGAVGRNYCYQVGSGMQVFFSDKEINPFMATGALATVIDDYNGDNFDHGGLGFFGGGIIFTSVSGGRPIQTRAVPPGTPRWGAAWKKATAQWYNHNFGIACMGSNYANRNNYLDLDPTYRDAVGRPLLRMTYNFTDNDYKMSAYCTDIVAKIAKAMNPTILGTPQPKRGDYNVGPYQGTHNIGGTIMGTNPRTTVVNRYLQAWDCDNLFVVGPSVFPQNAGMNPTGTIGAVAYWCADAITKRYLKRPGPLMHV
jgi:gluconate 2-dehydrogenase alpha chain